MTQPFWLEPRPLTSAAFIRAPAPPSVRFHPIEVTARIAGPEHGWKTRARQKSSVLTGYKFIDSWLGV